MKLLAGSFFKFSENQACLNETVFAENESLVFTALPVITRIYTLHNNAWRITVLLITIPVHNTHCMTSCANFCLVITINCRFNKSNRIILLKGFHVYWYYYSDYRCINNNVCTVAYMPRISCYPALTVLIDVVLFC